MKSFLPFLIPTCLWLGSERALAQNLNWGSLLYSDLADSSGETLDYSFVFEIGAFVDGFTPDDSNTGEWSSHWQTFDRAAYNGIEPQDDGVFGYFTSSVMMRADGTSDSPHLTPGASSFEGLAGFLWVRNSDSPEPGSEWLLVRAESWIFPTAGPECCGNDGVIEWSTSDLGSADRPVWGSQGGVEGDGFHSVGGIHTLQTHTFVPEPSSLMLAGWLGGCLLLRRRRTPIPT